MIKAKKTAYSALIERFCLLKDEPLKKYTSFKIGGKADLLAMPKTKQELILLLEQAYDLGLLVSFFGGGTNLLITDKGIRGLVVILKQLKSEISITKKDHNEKIICAKAGELLSKVCQFAVSQSLSGLEFCAGIPGTLGGAVMMNAGTKSKDMSHVVESIKVLDQNTLKIDTIKKTRP